LPAQWLPYDPAKRRFLKEPTLPASGTNNFGPLRIIEGQGPARPGAARLGVAGHG
jgi:hypothetical protein